MASVQCSDFGFKMEAMDYCLAVTGPTTVKKEVGEWDDAPALPVDEVRWDSSTVIKTEPEEGCVPQPLPRDSNMADEVLPDVERLWLKEEPADVQTSKPTLDGDVLPDQSRCDKYVYNAVWRPVASAVDGRTDAVPALDVETRDHLFASRGRLMFSEPGEDYAVTLDDDDIAAFSVPEDSGSNRTKPQAVVSQTKLQLSGTSLDDHLPFEKLNVSRLSPTQSSCTSRKYKDRPVRKSLLEAHQKSVPIVKSTRDAPSGKCWNYTCRETTGDQRFANGTDLRRHLKTHQAGESCGNKISTDNTIAPSGYVTCGMPHCGRTFQSKSSLRAHLKCHSNEKKVNRCNVPTCDAIFPRSQRLKQHLMRSHSDRRNLTCLVTQCRGSPKFDNLMDLRVHMYSHSEDFKYTCTEAECLRSFSNAFNLEAHMKCHSNDCECHVPGCKKSFSNLKALGLHLATHSKDLKFKCKIPECSEKFLNSYRLKRHVLRHHPEAFKCNEPLCNKSFPDRKQLEAHMETHSDLFTFACHSPGCNKRFDNEYFLKAHNVLHSLTPHFVCSVTGCGQRFLRMPHLQDHMFSHSDAKSFTCQVPLCSLHCKDKSSLLTHLMSSHSKTLAFKCDVPLCTKECTTILVLQKHIRTHCKTHVYACNVASCGKTYYSKGALDYHKMSHIETLDLVCPTCGMRFKHRVLLTRHRLSKHNTEKPSLPDAPAMFACHVPLCGKRFRTKNYLAVHARSTHSDVRAFQCDMCHKRFKTSSHLKNHMKVHGSGDVLACVICQKQFRYKTSLKFHMAAHDDYRLFACQLCGKGFNTKGKLRLHEMSMHAAVKPFECDVCHCRFADKRRIASHVLTHLQDQTRIACDAPHCGKTFRRMFQLRKHIKAKHNENSQDPLECNICHKRFGNKYIWKSHVEHFHSEVKAFVCSIGSCSKSFKMKYRLKEHVLLVHNKSGLFECKVCRVRFYESSVLDGHKCLRSSDKSSRCEVFTTQREDNAESKHVIHDTHIATNALTWDS